MAPKVKVTREDIINTAVDLVQKAGEQAINARNIAAALNCSTQPVFSNFATMEELRLAVAKQAEKLCEKYIESEIKKEEFPVYKASGMGYIRFAKEEKELFKLLYMRNRSKENMTIESDLNSKMELIIKSNTALNKEEIKLFHLEMWAFVHGIAAMFATGFLDLEWQRVSKMLTDAHLGLRKQYGLEEEVWKL